MIIQITIVSTKANDRRDEPRRQFLLREDRAGHLSTAFVLSLSHESR